MNLLYDTCKRKKTLLLPSDNEGFWYSHLWVVLCFNSVILCCIHGLFSPYSIPNKLYNLWLQLIKIWINLLEKDGYFMWMWCTAHPVPSYAHFQLLQHPPKESWLWLHFHCLCNLGLRLLLKHIFPILLIP